MRGRVTQSTVTAPQQRRRARRLPATGLARPFTLFPDSRGAAAEELVYRALLQRALEGFLKPGLALALQALVFELVHLFVYGYGFANGFWFVAGLVYGYAFAQTRSIAVPTLLHAAHNVIFHALLWFLAGG
jgi:membrane protease YdiL (CAAX protease family)